MQRFCFTLFFLLLSCNSASSLFSQPVNPSKPKVTIKQISQICMNSPFDCLAEADPFLATIPENSRMYFQVLQYKMEALFNLQRDDELYLETKKWIDHLSVPLTFQLTNAIFLAKAAWDIGKKEEAKETYYLAKSLLSQINNEYSTPLRLVQFANLQIQLKELDSAYQLLQSLAEKYPNSPDVHFMVELHGNLGHTANQLGLVNEALVHWNNTKKWVLLFNNQQQIGIVLFNLADVHEQLSQYQQARTHFAEGIEYSKKAGDKVKMNEGMYRLLNVRLMSEKVCLSDPAFSSFDLNYLPKKFNYSLQVLKRKAKCK